MGQSRRRRSRCRRPHRAGRNPSRRTRPVAPLASHGENSRTTLSSNSASTHAPSSRGRTHRRYGTAVLRPTNLQVKPRAAYVLHPSGPKKSILGRWYCPPRTTTVGVVTNSLLTEIAAEAKASKVPVSPREGANDAERGLWNDRDGACCVRFRWVRVGVPMTTPSPTRWPNQHAALSIPMCGRGARWRTDFTVFVRRDD